MELKERICGCATHRSQGSIFRWHRVLQVSCFFQSTQAKGVCDATDFSPPFPSQNTTSRSS